MIRAEIAETSVRAHGGEMRYDDGFGSSFSWAKDSMDLVRELDNIRPAGAVDLPDRIKALHSISKSLRALSAQTREVAKQTRQHVKAAQAKGNARRTSV